MYPHGKFGLGSLAKGKLRTSELPTQSYFKMECHITAFLHLAVLPCDVHTVSHPEFTEHCLSFCQARRAILFSREIAVKNCQIFAFFIIYVLILMLIFPELSYLRKKLNCDLLLFHHISSLKRFSFWICTKFLTKTIRNK